MHVCKTLEMLHAAQPTSKDKLHKLFQATLVLKCSSDFSAESQEIGSVTQGMLL